MAEFTQPLQRRTFRFQVEPAGGTPRLLSFLSDPATRGTVGVTSVNLAYDARLLGIDLQLRADALRLAVGIAPCLV
jgi:hypothetical protein